MSKMQCAAHTLMWGLGPGAHTFACVPVRVRVIVCVCVLLWLGGFVAPVLVMHLPAVPQAHFSPCCTRR
jgi:hypothetical protein